MSQDETKCGKVVVDIFDSFEDAVYECDKLKDIREDDDEGLIEESTENVQMDIEFFS